MIPMHIMLPIVVLGIAAVVLLVHMTGGTMTRHIDDLADAQAIWAGDHPDEARIDDLGHAALVHLNDGRRGVIRAFGDDAVVRHLDGSPEVADQPDGLLLHMDDFIAPAIRVVLADEDDRAAWRTALQAQTEELEAWTTSPTPT
ncbi:hypothetical protein [Halovulum sp. GXIMD14793]